MGHPSNRTEQDWTSGLGPCGEHFPTVLPSNRIAQLGYDAAGNVTSEGPTTYQYDAENRMVSINGGGSSPAYLYDANGRRIRKTVSGVSTDFLYDLSGLVVAERQGAVWTKGYVYLGGQLLVQYDNILNPSTTLAVHTDHIGSTRLLTKVDRSLQECNDYYPYGELIPCGTATTTSTYKFAGKERDAAVGETGLDYFVARYYAPFHGRFRSPDPENAGAFTADPQSWNAYTYARNSPLTYVDPTGQTWCKAKVNGNGEIIEIDITNCVEDEDYDPRLYPDYVRVNVDESVFVEEPKEEQEDLPWWDLPGHAFVTFGECALNGNAWKCGEWVVGAVPIGRGLVFVFGKFGRVVQYVIPKGTPAPLVSNSRLGKIIAELFRETDVYAGGTAGALRHEAVYGELLSPKGHYEKAKQTIVALGRILADENLSFNDAIVIRNVIQELRDAVILYESIRKP